VRPAARTRSPFQLREGNPRSPVLLLCEHASNRLPFRSAPTPEERRVLDSHWGWDIGAWPLTLALARRWDAGAVGGRWSRLLIDLNRRVDDETLIRREAGGVRLSWNRELDDEEIERRVLTWHVPYHARVEASILRRLVRGVRPLLVSVHSFTPVYEGRGRPFQVGILFDRHEALARRVGRALERQGLEVRYNRPYSGRAGMMYSAERHGGHHALPSLELELNQAICSRPAAIGCLAERLGAAIESVSPPPGADPDAGAR
jgi:predicted N-formylglutamate amidohydrolase